MTTEPSIPASKSRKFTALDCVVFALAVCSFAAPFAAHLQVDAQAATPQVAVRSEVSPVRPIDFALGYEEKRAEAAFFEGLGEEYKSSADIALDVAPAEPRDDVEKFTPIAEAVALLDPAQGVEDQPVPDDIAVDLDQPMPIEEPADRAEIDMPTGASPTPRLDISVIATPLLLDIAIEADVSDAPPAPAPAPASEPELVEERDETVPLIKVMMTAPPTMTPFPTKRPFREVTTPIETVMLDSSRMPELPLDVTPPMPSVIEEIPLAPLEVMTTPIVEQPSTPVAVETVETIDMPLVMTPEPQIETVVASVQSPAPSPARPATRLRTGPRIALVIAAAGLNEDVTRLAIEALPSGVSLAFAPVKAEAAAWAREAKADGHTVLVEIPLEPVNRNRDPGPMTLRVSASPDKNIEKLNSALARIPVAEGASTYLGARFNTDERAVAPVVNALAGRNMFLFENEPTTRSAFQRLSARAKLPYARSVMKIDRTQSTAAIREALAALEKQARERGVAIGVGTALRGTISTVALWAKEAEKRGVRLVPIFEVAR